jgi:hypothetical protein
MPDYLNQNVSAYHLDRKAVKENNYNENNPGIGYEHESEDGKWRQMVGAYKNSTNKNSAYGLIGYTPIQSGDFSAGVFGGAVTGYEKQPVRPAAGILFTYQGDDIGANVTVVPNVPSKNIHGFIGLQLRYAMEDFLKD